MTQEKFTKQQLATVLREKYGADLPNATDDQLVQIYLEKHPEDVSLLQESPLTQVAASAGKGTAIKERTLKDTVRGYLISAMRSTPEIGGQIAGGSIGFGLGGIPGAAIGGGIGAMTGETIRQIMAKIFGGESVWSKGAEEPKGKKAAIDQIYAAVLGGGSEGIGRTLPLMMQRTVRPETQRGLNIAEGEGLPYTAGDVRPGSTAQVTENLMRGTLFGGNVMGGQTMKTAQRLYIYREKMLNGLGPLLDKEELGKAITGAVEQRHMNLVGPGGVFERLYNRMSNLYATNIDTSHIRKESKKILDKVQKIVSEGRIPSAKSGEKPSRFLGILEDLSVYGQQKQLDPVTKKVVLVDKPLTYADVWKDKQTIDAMIRSMPDDPLRTEAKGTLKQIHNILDEAMERGAQKVDPKAAAQIRKINRMYAETKKLYETESLVSDIGKLDPERIANRYFAETATTPAQDLLKALGSAERNRLLPAVQRRKVQDVIAKSSKMMQEQEVTSGAVFEHQLKSNMDSLKILFDRNPEKWAAIRDFIEGAKFVQRNEAMLNPASGRQLLAYGQLGALVAGVTGTFGIGPLAGNTEAQAGAYTAVIGPAVLARMLCNPAIARFLSQGFRMTPKSQGAAKWTARVMNWARIIDSNLPEEEKGEGLQEIK